MAERIVGFDLDGTLVNEQCWTIEDIQKSTLNEEVHAKLVRDFQTGFIVIYTARRDELIPATLEWLRRNNVRYHAFSNIKMPADVYIDDKAIHVNDYR